MRVVSGAGDSGPHVLTCVPGSPPVTPTSSTVFRESVEIDGSGGLVLNVGGSGIFLFGANVDVTLRRLTIENTIVRRQRGERLELRDVTLVDAPIYSFGGEEYPGTVVLNRVSSTGIGGIREAVIWGETEFDRFEISESQFIGNTVTDGLGVAPIEFKAGFIDRSLIQDNTSWEYCGGVSVGSAAGPGVVIRRTTIAGNQGPQCGGVHARSGSVLIENSTVTGNIAITASPISPVSGGISASCADLTVVHTTISGNVSVDGYAYADAGYVSFGVFGSCSHTTFVNSIIEGECLPPSGPIAQFPGGTLTSIGGNVESPGDSCSFGEPTDQPSVTGVALALAGLGDNQGPTPTKLPLTASVAIDGGIGSACLLMDQRGAIRPGTGDGPECDSGAVEVPEPTGTLPLLCGVLLGGRLCRTSRGADGRRRSSRTA